MTFTRIDATNNCPADKPGCNTTKALRIHRGICVQQTVITSNIDPRCVLTAWVYICTRCCEDSRSKRCVCSSALTIGFWSLRIEGGCACNFTHSRVAGKLYQSTFIRIRSSRCPETLVVEESTLIQWEAGSSRIGILREEHSRNQLAIETAWLQVWSCIITVVWRLPNHNRFLWRIKTEVGCSIRTQLLLNTAGLRIVRISTREIRIRNGCYARTLTARSHPSNKIDMEIIEAFRVFRRRPTKCRCCFTRIGHNRWQRWVFAFKVCAQLVEVAITTGYKQTWILIGSVNWGTRCQRWSRRRRWQRSACCAQRIIDILIGIHSSEVKDREHTVCKQHRCNVVTERCVCTSRSRTHHVNT